MKTIIALLACLYVMPVMAAITVFEPEDASTNYIFLFADLGSRSSTPLTFNSLDFSGDMDVSGWSLGQPLEPLIAILTGPAVNRNTSTYNLNFNASKNIVSMQWSEILYSGGIWNVVSDGTREYNSTLGLWQNIGTPFTTTNTQYITDYFNGIPPSPVPVPPSIVYLTTALIFCFTKRNINN